jgi:hypothetical protein
MIVDFGFLKWAGRPLLPFPFTYPKSTIIIHQSNCICAPPQDSVDPNRQIWEPPEVPQAKTKPATTTAGARTARRRAGWKIVVADSFAEAEAETRAYWRAATPAERLNALEKLRKPFYGKDQIGGRLQRFLEVVPAE